MKRTLESLISKTKSGLKNATLGAIMLTPLVGNLNEVQDVDPFKNLRRPSPKEVQNFQRRGENDQQATYDYFVQESNQSSNFSSTKKGLYEIFESEGIISTGRYQNESSQPKNSMTITNKLDNSFGKISFSYDLRQDLETKGQRLFEENSSRTNVYFAVPKDSLEGIYQEVSVFDYSEKRHKTLFATDGANQRLEEQLGKFNRGIATLKGQQQQDLNEAKNEYEIALDNAIDLAPGKIGMGLKAGKNLLKKLGQKNEEKRIQNLQEKFGEDYEIIRMPSNSTNGSLSELFFTHGITGRKTILIYNPEKIKDGQKIHISAPNLTFTKMQNGLERTTEIGGLEYEIALETQGDHEGIYGDWVSFYEIIQEGDIYNNGHFQISLKKNPKGNIDVRFGILEQDFEASTFIEENHIEEYTSQLEKTGHKYIIQKKEGLHPFIRVFKESEYFSKNCKFQTNVPLFSSRAINSLKNQDYSIQQIKDIKKFSDNWWNKEVFLNSFTNNFKTSRNQKDLNFLKKISLKTLGPNTLLYTHDSEDADNDNFLLVRKGSIAKSASLKEFYGEWSPIIQRKKIGMQFAETKYKINSKSVFENKINKVFQLDNSFFGFGNEDGITIINHKGDILFGESFSNQFHHEIQEFLEKSYPENSSKKINQNKKVLFKDSQEYKQIKSDLKEISQIIEFYKLKNKQKLPRNSIEFQKILEDNYGLEKKYFEDPWGREYIFEKNGNKCLFKTLGADGSPGGTGKNEDVVVREDYLKRSWELERDMEGIHDGLITYFQKNGKIPKDLMELKGILEKNSFGKYVLDPNLKDPWGRKYIFEKIADPEYLINLKTLGEDGIPGGLGEDEDITRSFNY